MCINHVHAVSTRMFSLSPKIKIVGDPECGGAEIDDLIQLALDLIATHAQDSAVHEDSLPSRHLAMEPRALVGSCEP